MKKITILLILTIAIFSGCSSDTKIYDSVDLQQSCLYGCTEATLIYDDANLFQGKSYGAIDDLLTQCENKCSSFLGGQIKDE